MIDSMETVGGATFEELVERSGEVSMTGLATAGLKPTGAAMRRGKSKQDYQTPPEFLTAVQGFFGPIVWDLAAHAGNHVCADYWGPGGAAPDSLTCNWNMLSNLWGIGWLNPPFDNIRPWVKKARESTAAEILILVPASTGTNWFKSYCHDYADVYFLSPRIKFVGAKDPYPKDLMLLHFHLMARGKYRCWNWKTGELV